MQNQPRWTVLGVPIDSVGTVEGGPASGTERSPAALRAAGLVVRVGADDVGDLDVRITGSRRDPSSGLVGGATVAPVVAEVRRAVARLLEDGRRPFVVGGCCALVVGAVPAVRDVLGDVALLHVDGHLDLYDHRTSPTGEVADMPVALLLGIGEPGLLAASAPAPLDGGSVVVLGARDPDEPHDVADVVESVGLVTIGPDDVRSDAVAAAQRALDHVQGRPVWVHLDVDVLDQDAFPATDYLLPGGLSLDELVDLLRPLASSGAVVGFSVACYNPDKDPDGRWGDELVGLLSGAFGGTS
jgi:arginase